MNDICFALSSSWRVDKAAKSPPSMAVASLFLRALRDEVRENSGKSKMPLAQTASEGELGRDYSTWTQQSSHALYETAKIRHLREHIVADQEISLYAVAHVP
jgi:hypothetical protein